MPQNYAPAMPGLFLFAALFRDRMVHSKDAGDVMENYRQGLARINSKQHYDEYAGSGFFTLIREDDGKDTREEVCNILARHFGLTD